jgi:RNA polymerase sigma-70 factor (ECF subfamily)
VTSREAAVKGDAPALDRLFSSCIPQLQRTAARLLCCPQDSEDALQDALLSAFRHLSKFEGRAQFSTWMHTIVANAAKSILRKQRRRPLMSSLDEPQPEHEGLRLSDILPDPRAGLEEGYARAERSQLLALFLQNLPPTHRSIVLLCDVEGLCLQEAAKRLGLSLSAVKTRHLRANRFILNVVKRARERQLPILTALAQMHEMLGLSSNPAGKIHHCQESIRRRKRNMMPPRLRSNCADPVETLVTGDAGRLVRRSL